MTGVFRAAFRRPAPRRAFFLSASLTRKLKLMCHPDAASATAVSGAVFLPPSGGALLGDKIGEFSGKTFEAALESGQAVLKVPVGEFSGGGGLLEVGDFPVCVFEATTDAGSALGAAVAFGSVGAHECTVIDE